MAFSDILGHQKQILTLTRALERNRLHHAYFFLGPDGVGKKTVALTLAAALHCTRTASDACGQCDDCRRIHDGNHPDVRVVGLDKGKREITIAQIRALQRVLELRSFSGRKKVAIIDPARLMNYHAQNSLLKTLEDPPGDALIVLIDHSTGDLLSTLLSRCLRLCFPLLPVDQAARILVAQRGLSEEQALIVATVTGGSVGEVLSADHQKLLDRRGEWIERLSSLSPGDLRGAIALAEEVARDREKAASFLQWIKEWYRDILVYQCGGADLPVKNRDLMDRVRAVAQSAGLEQTLAVLARVDQAARRLQRNYNRRLILEDFFINLVESPPRGS